MLGWRLLDNGSSKTAEAALKEAVVHRFSAGPHSQPLALRSGSGLVLSSWHYTAAVKAYGLTPEQNGLFVCLRSMKEDCT